MSYTEKSGCIISSFVSNVVISVSVGVTNTSVGRFDAKISEKARKVAVVVVANSGTGGSSVVVFVSRTELYSVVFSASTDVGFDAVVKSESLKSGNGILSVVAFDCIVVSNTATSGSNNTVSSSSDVSATGKLGKVGSNGVVVSTVFPVKMLMSDGSVALFDVMNVSDTSSGISSSNFSVV